MAPTGKADLTKANVLLDLLIQEPGRVLEGSVYQSGEEGLRSMIDAFRPALPQLLTVAGGDAERPRKTTFLRLVLEARRYENARILLEECPLLVMIDDSVQPPIEEVVAHNVTDEAFVRVFVRTALECGTRFQPGSVLHLLQKWPHCLSEQNAFQLLRFNCHSDFESLFGSHDMISGSFAQLLTQTDALWYVSNTHGPFMIYLCKRIAVEEQEGPVTKNARKSQRHCVDRSRLMNDIADATLRRRSLQLYKAGKYSSLFSQFSKYVLQHRDDYELVMCLLEAIISRCKEFVLKDDVFTIMPGLLSLFSTFAGQGKGDAASCILNFVVKLIRHDLLNPLGHLRQRVSVGDLHVRTVLDVLMAVYAHAGTETPYHRDLEAIIVNAFKDHDGRGSLVDIDDPVSIHPLALAIQLRSDPLIQLFIEHADFSCFPKLPWAGFIQSMIVNNPKELLEQLSERLNLYQLRAFWTLPFRGRQVMLKSMPDQTIRRITLAERDVALATH